MAKIKTLRASGTSLRADVVIGATKYGGDVTVQVEVSRRDQDVAAALESLTSLLSTRAEAFIVEAGVAKQVQDRVQAELKERTAVERERLAKNADQKVLSLVEGLERLLGTEATALEAWQVTRLRTALAQARKDLPAQEAKAS